MGHVASCLVRTGFVSGWAIVASSGHLVVLSVCHLLSAKPLGLSRKCVGAAFLPSLTNFKASQRAPVGTYHVPGHS